MYLKVYKLIHHSQTRKPQKNNFAKNRDSVTPTRATVLPLWFKASYRK